MEDAISKKARSVEQIAPIRMGRQPFVFVESGQKVRRKKKVHVGVLDATTDWIVQIDLRKKQVQFPLHIITTPERPDLVMSSDMAKVVVILELAKTLRSGGKSKLLSIKSLQRTSAKEEFGKSMSSQKTRRRS